VLLFHCISYLCGINGAWRSPVAHLLWEQGVPGSNPGAPTLQRVEMMAVPLEPSFFFVVTVVESANIHPVGMCCAAQACVKVAVQ
jgi:hypothetical protein